MDRRRALRVLELAEAGHERLVELDADLVPAIRYLIDNDRAAAFRLVAALPSYWLDSGRIDEGRALTEEALVGHARAAVADRDVAAAVARALLAASELAFRQRDRKAARRRARDAIRAAVLIEDRATAELAYASLARAAYRDGDAPQVHSRPRALDLAPPD